MAHSNMKNRQRTVIKWIIRFILILLAILFIFPLVWNLLNSLKTNTEFITDPFALPKGFEWQNYVRACSKSNLSVNIWNSVYVVFLTLLITIGCTVPCSYCLVRYRFPLSRLILGILMAAIFIDGTYIVIPLFIELKTFHILNSLTALAFVYSAFQIPFSVFLLTGYLKGVARDYEEAAEIDGCSAAGVLFNITIPLCKQGIMTIATLCVITAWNEFPIALVTVTDPAKKTLPVGLANLYAIAKFATDWGALFAGLMIALVPTILLFIIFERQLLQGIAVGGIKG